MTCFEVSELAWVSIYSLLLWGPEPHSQHHEAYWALSKPEQCVSLQFHRVWPRPPCCWVTADQTKVKTLDIKCLLPLWDTARLRAMQALFLGKQENLRNSRPSPGPWNLRKLRSQGSRVYSGSPLRPLPSKSTPQLFISSPYHHSPWTHKNILTLGT